MANTVEIVIRGIDAATPVINKVSQSMDKATKSTNAMSHGMNGLSGHLGKVASLAEGVLIGMLAFQAVRLPGVVISTAVQAYASYERLGLTLKNLIAVEKYTADASLTMAKALAQSGAEAKELIDWTERLAVLSPFTQETVATTLQTAMGYGMSSKMAKELTQALADYAAGTGKSEDQTKLLGLALGQVWSKGRLTGEEMRQLTNAGMGVELMATATGLSMAEFAEVMKEGELDAKQLIPRLIELADERFAGAAKRQATSWAGLLSTLDDITKIGLREFFADTLIAIQPYMTDFLEQWPELKKQIQETGEVLGKDIGEKMQWLANDVFPAFGAAAKLAGEHLMLIKDAIIGISIGLAVRNLPAMITSLTVALMGLTTPAGLITLALAGVGVAAAAWAENWGGVRDKTVEAADSLGDGVKQAFGVAETAVTTSTHNMQERITEFSSHIGLSNNAIKDSMTDVRKYMDTESYLMLSHADELGQRLLSRWEDYKDQQRAIMGTQPRDTNLPRFDSLWEMQRELQFAQEQVRKGAFTVVDALDAEGDAARRNYPPITTSSKEHENLAKKMQDVIASGRDMVSYFVSIDPAAMAASAAVETLRLRLVGLQDQQAAFRESIRAAQDVLQGMRDQVNALSDALSTAKQRLTDLTTPQLEGMGEMDDQIFQMEQAIKRARLEEMGVDISNLPPLSEEAQALYETLKGYTVPELEDLLEVLQLQKSLKFDEMLRKIQKEAKGVEEELTFDEAIKRIKDTKIEIGNLEGQLAAAEEAAKAQTAAIASMESAAEALTKAVQQLQKDLEEQERKQKLVNDALELAYDWYVDDRQKLVEMGDEAKTQAETIDEATQTLLSTTRSYAEGEASVAIAAINAALLAYRAARVEIAGGLAGATGSNVYRSQYAAWQAARTLAGENPNDWEAFRAHMIALGFADPGSVAFLARGARNFRGGRAIVGEDGPELVDLPRGANVYPASDTRQMLAGATNNFYFAYAGVTQSGAVQDYLMVRALVGD